jgi:hypothetical protein
MNWTAILILFGIYVVGARWPGLARRIGLA